MKTYDTIYVIIMAALMIGICILMIMVVSGFFSFRADAGTITVGDIEIEYVGSKCENGLLKLQHAHIRTEDWDGINMDYWTVPVWCEE